MSRRENIFSRIKSRITGVLSNRKFLKAALAVCAFAFVCALLYLGYILYTHLKGQQITEQVNTMFEEAKQQTIYATPLPYPPKPDIEALVVQEEHEESEWDRERRELLEAEALGRLTFADILAINPDFRGMIEVPGLIERQPYVMTVDNEKYLDTDFNGNRSRNGTIFLSAYNDRLLMDNNSIFFGHHASTGAMFTQLVEYKKAQTFEKSPIVILDGLTGETTWIIFAAHVVEPDSWWIIPYNNTDDYAAHLEEIMARSLFDTDVDIDITDRIITLALCDYTYEDMRFVVHARRLRPGEDIPESVTATVNADRKDYVIPHQNALRDLDMTGAAIAANPITGRLFFYTPVTGGIMRYSGNTREAQGPFTALERNGISRNTNLAVEIIRARDDEHSRAVYLAAQGLGGGPGISLFTAHASTASLYHEGLITPEGVDARNPSIQSMGGVVWLYYSVPGSDGSSNIHRQPVRGGTSTLLHTVYGVSGVRPLGIIVVHGQSVLVWFEPNSGDINGAVIGLSEGGSAQTAQGAPFNISNVGANVRVMRYGDVSGLTMPCIVETGGRLSFTSIDLSEAPITPMDTTEDPNAVPDYATSPPDYWGSWPGSSDNTDTGTLPGTDETILPDPNETPGPIG